MKLKEKLAQEYICKLVDPLSVDYFDAKKNFIAGFEKARELSQSRALEMSKLFVSNSDMDRAANQRSETIAKMIGVLGEEEVK